MLKHLKYSLAALSMLVALSLLMQCSDGEEILPASTCKPETCEFKVTQTVKVENRQ